MRSNKLLLKLDIVALGVNYWTPERKKAFNALVRAIKKLNNKEKK